MGRLKVDENNAGLVESLHANCAKWPKTPQLVRELTENSIRAVLRASAVKSGSLFKGEVIWSWCMVRNKKNNAWVRKLVICDNGPSMSVVEFGKFMDTLGGGYGEHGINSFFGLGAKIACLPLNKLGMIYICWQENEAPRAYRIFLNGKAYESEQLDWNTFKHEYKIDSTWQNKNDKHKPEIVKNSGTMVILCGNQEDEDTTEWETRGEQWIAKGLSTRYQHFPDGVRVKLRSPVTAKSGSHYNQTVFSQDKIRNEYCNIKGERTFNVGGVKGEVGYGIITGYKQGSHNRFFDIAGSVSVTFGDENYYYHKFDSEEGRALMRAYGVTAGLSRVILTIKFDSAQASIARNSLMINGDPIDPHAFAVEFANKLPKQLDEFIKEAHGKVKYSSICQKDNNLFSRFAELISTFGRGVIGRCGIKGSRGNTVNVGFRDYNGTGESRGESSGSSHEGTSARGESQTRGTQVSGTVSSKGVQRRGIPEIDLLLDTADSCGLPDSTFCDYQSVKGAEQFICNANYPKFADMIGKIQNHLPQVTRNDVYEKANYVLKEWYFESFLMSNIDCAEWDAVKSEYLSSKSLTDDFDKHRFTILKRIEDGLKKGRQAVIPLKSGSEESAAG